MKAIKLTIPELLALKTAIIVFDLFCLDIPDATFEYYMSTRRTLQKLLDRVQSE